MMKKRCLNLAFSVLRSVPLPLYKHVFSWSYNPNCFLGSESAVVLLSVPVPNHSFVLVVNETHLFKKKLADSMLSAMQKRRLIGAHIKRICKFKFVASQIPMRYSGGRQHSSLMHIFRDLCYFACARTKPTHVLRVSWRQWRLVWVYCITPC